MNSNDDFRITIEAWQDEHILTITEAALLWTRNTPPIEINDFRIAEQKLIDESLILHDKADEPRLFQIYMKNLIKEEVRLENYMTENIANRNLFDKIRSDLCEAVSLWNSYDINIREYKENIDQAETEDDRERATKAHESLIKEFKNHKHLYLEPFNITMRYTAQNPPANKNIDSNKTKIFRENLVDYAIANNIHPDFLQNDIEKLKTQNTPKKSRQNNSVLHKPIREALKELKKGDKFPMARKVLEYIETNYKAKLDLKVVPSVRKCTTIYYSNHKGKEDDITYHGFETIVSNIRTELSQ